MESINKLVALYSIVKPSLSWFLRAENAGQRQRNLFLMYGVVIFEKFVDI